jgi:hypothetical protein
MGQPSPSLEICPVCGGDRFTTEPVLWPELIEQWGLSADEAAYINLQQGFCCTACKNNLRTMTLAAAVTGAFGFAGSLKDFCRNDPDIRRLNVVEINPAKNLSAFLQVLPKHALHSFPQLDMQRMTFADSSIDIIIHSDTLEHVAGRLKGGSERVTARSETGGPFILYCANRCGPPDPDTARFGSKLSRKTGGEPGRLRCANGIRRRFLVRDFRGRIS